MKKIKFYTAALLAVVGVSALVNVAKAEETVTEPKTAISDANVGIMGADEETEPEIIDKDLDLEGNNETGQKGPLTLDLVPNFNFGSEAIKSDGNILKVDESKNLAVQVSDQRGTGAGWNLSLELSDFANLDEEAELEAAVLKGVKLATVIGNHVTTANNPNKDAEPLRPEVSLIPGEEGVVYHAAAKTGLGTWLGYFVEDSKSMTTLSIPAGNYVGEYAATLTWTLANAPK